MSDYTTKTASLKATTIDTAKIDAKQIDTKTLNINGISIDEKLKQAAIASRGNLIGIFFQDSVAVMCGIVVKDGQILDEPMNCNCEIINGFSVINNNVLVPYEKKYLKITHENGDSVFNLGTTVNKCISINIQEFDGTTIQVVEEIKLKELILTDSTNKYTNMFELGEIDDNLEEVYGGAFWGGTIYISYQDNALTTILEQETSSSTYSLIGENTSIFDKFRESVQENS